jgi:hypothetical protein
MLSFVGFGYIGFGYIRLGFFMNRHMNNYMREQLYTGFNMQVTNKKFQESICVRLNSKNNIGEDVRIYIEHLDCKYVSKSLLDIVMELNTAKEVYKMLGECIAEGEIRSQVKSTHEEDD